MDVVKGKANHKGIRKMTKTIDNTKPVSLADMEAFVAAGRMRRLTKATDVPHGTVVYGHHSTAGGDEWSEYVPMRVERRWKNAIRLRALTDGTNCRIVSGVDYVPSTWRLDSDEVFVLVTDDAEVERRVRLLDITAEHVARDIMSMDDAEVRAMLADMGYPCEGIYTGHWPTAAGDTCRRCGAVIVRAEPMTPAERHRLTQDAYVRLHAAGAITSTMDSAPCIYPERKPEPTPVVGARVCLRRDVERFPHFRVAAGAFGTVTDVSDGNVSVRMDDHVPGAETWANEIVWDTTAEPGRFAEDTASWVDAGECAECGRVRTLNAYTQLCDFCAVEASR